MAQTSPNGPTGRKPSLFARRQVYLRAGQDSQYVELSPMLQIGVALGFGALALWLIGASYGAVTGYLGKDKELKLLTRLGGTEQALEDAERARDLALADIARIPDLEAELLKAQAAADASEAALVNPDEALALTAELEQTRAQLDELHLRLSESKADQAALQARFEAEALATSDASTKTAEEAASLHAQLEEAYQDVETLQKGRDELTANLAAAEEDNAVLGETTERNTALLKAATAEIERLQETLSLAEAENQNASEEEAATIARLEAERDEAIEAQRQAMLARTELEATIETLNADLEAARSAAAEPIETAVATDADDGIERDAALQAQSIAAGLEEADLLAEIEDLRAELAASGEAGNAEAASAGEGEDVRALRERVVVAEAEIERLILAGLTAEDESAPAPTVPPSEDPAETERLRAELLDARADIIKLEADVKAAKQRLAEKTEAENGQASKPDNSAKLEQQLASSRSRVQKLNKALADAKLREVAIDLALINVVPAPSPPAPR